MNPVPMQCPLCAGMIQIDPAYAGQQVGCPLCQGVMLLPPPEFFGLPPAGYAAEPPPNFSPPYPPQDFSQPAPPPPGYPPQYSQEAPPTLPQLGCPVCGGAFQVSPEMAGHQVACPHCQNAVSIPDLFGGAYSAGPGFEPPPPPPNFSAQGPAYFEMPPQPMQFISPPTGPMEEQEIPTGYAVQSMPPPDVAPPPEPGMIPGVPVGLAVAPPPHDDRFPPSRAREQSSPTPTNAERRGDANLYPPGMTPKDALAQKEMERGEQPERPRDDRFPPGMGRSEYQERKAAETKPMEARTADVPPSQVNDLLPPGADPLLPPATAPQSTVDTLLPPAAAAAGVVAPEADETFSRHTVVDTLLPPGTSTDPSANPTEQVALPAAPPPAPKPIPASAPGRLVLPTPDGDYVTVENKEGVKTISDRGEEIEIRKLSPEERLRRRRAKNAVMFTIAILLLAVVIYIMTRK
ncbi:MAG: hypothetical protein ACR2FY_19530 [Pirellulaceae bacterium]